MKPQVLHTQRLRLRPFEPADVTPFLAIQGHWRVTRMLRLASFPPDPGRLSAFVGGAGDEWRAGSAFRFTVVHGEAVIGCADIDEIAEGWGELGYWLDPSAWGRGLASEAAAAVRDFGFATVRLNGLRSGHADDNPASGKVLTKLGFIDVGVARRWSGPRNAEILQHLYRLDRPS